MSDIFKNQLFEILGVDNEFTALARARQLASFEAGLLTATGETDLDSAFDRVLESVDAPHGVVVLPPIDDEPTHYDEPEGDGDDDDGDGGADPVPVAADSDEPSLCDLHDAIIAAASDDVLPRLSLRERLGLPPSSDDSGAAAEVA